MEVGDLVKYCADPVEGLSRPIGLVIHKDDRHRQHYMSVLFDNGVRMRIWEGHLEVVNESR